jgi:hypothetical protein
MGEYITMTLSDDEGEEEILVKLIGRYDDGLL